MGDATTMVPTSTSKPESFLERNLPFSLEILIGIVVGCSAVLFILCVIIACCCCRRNRKRPDSTLHLESGHRKSQNNSYLNQKVPADIPTSGHVAKAKKKLQRGGQLSFKVKDVLTNTLIKQVESYTIEADRLKLGEVLGSGQFGLVYKAQMYDKDKEKTEDVAVKTMQGEDCSQEDVQKFLEEVLLMRGFHHKNVLSLIGLSVIDDKPYAVLPFMHNGDLKTYIKDSSRQFMIKDLLVMCCEVADGMTYLSEQGFVHRDLAARNCMVDANVVVKIADFGLSRDLFTDDYYRMESLNTPLPVRWMAVECFKSQKFTTKSDVWSFGVFMWEVMTRGKNPYPDRDNLNVLEYVKKGGRPLKPPHVPNDIYNAMQLCWKEDPEQRPVFTDISSVLHGKLQGHTMPGRQYENIVQAKSPLRSKSK